MTIHDSNLPTTPQMFGEIYTADVAAIVENFDVLKQLLNRDYLLNEPEACSYIKICSVLLVDACRMLAEAVSPDFACGSADERNEDLRHRRAAPLIRSNSRKIFRIESSDPSGSVPQSMDTLTAVEGIHSAAEDLLFSPCEIRSEDRATAREALDNAQRVLMAFLRRHAVLLPEWNCLCLVEVDQTGEPSWSLVMLPADGSLIFRSSLSADRKQVSETAFAEEDEADSADRQK